MEEIWKDAVGWEGLYQVSNLGRVRSLDRFVKVRTKNGKNIKGKVLVLRYDKDGYLTVNLSNRNEGKNKLCKVHRLIAEAFIPKIDGKNNVDHINGIRDDNSVENLRWCTIKENVSFPLARENKSLATKNSYNKFPELRKIRARDIGYLNCIKIRVKKSDILIGIYNSISDFAKEHSLPYSSLCECLKCGKDYKDYKLEKI